MTGQNALTQANKDPQTIREWISLLREESKELHASVSILKESLATVSMSDAPETPIPTKDEQWLPHSCDQLRDIHRSNMYARLQIEDIQRKLAL